MHHFKLTILFLVIVILANTETNAQNNNNVNTNANTNVNANVNGNKSVNTNVNTNTNINSNANTNANTNANFNANTNTNSTKTPAPDASLQVVFLGVDPNDKSNVVLKAKDISNPLQTYTFLVKEAETKALVTKFKEGDIVSVTTDKDAKTLKDISIVSQQVNRFWHYFFPVLVFAALIVLSWLLLRPRAKDLIVGQDNRYSKSKVQIAGWFFVLISSYVAVLIIRLYYSDWNLIGGIGIPTNLLLLSGLSAFTFAAAKGITQGNVEAAGVSKPKALQPRFADLFQDDAGRIDLADFQMIIVVFLAIITYIVQIFGFLSTVELYQSVSLPDVDSTILAAFGLGQGAYLVKKAVSEGPPTPPANPPSAPTILTPANLPTKNTGTTTPTFPEGGN